MNKRIERLITTAGIAALVAVFCYQVAYGKMSKEYMYEFDLEKNNALNNVYAFDDTCEYGPYKPVGNLPTAGWVNVHPSDALKQQQCTQGFDDAWNKYCHIGAIRHPENKDLAADSVSIEFVNLFVD